ncbi:GTP pyrophosphokinase family protein [Kribbella sp. NPDC050124]|uniref:GTP pyrophosphokinase family protein n=1 Tax=Kribbella sp. NPDC050124 TaxID=3364114 RepID=UPI00379AB7B8
MASADLLITLGLTALGEVFAGGIAGLGPHGTRQNTSISSREMPARPGQLVLRDLVSLKALPIELATGIAGRGLVLMVDDGVDKVAQLRDRYGAEKTAYDRLCGEAIFSMKSELSGAGIKFHSVTGRVKDLEGFLEKIERKNYDDPFVQTQDLVGIRIVCLFLSDIQKIETIVANMFDVISKDDHIESGPVDSFGYMSVHYVCKLGSRHVGARYSGLTEQAFEVQIRTIVMDAWANISHQLAYKGELSVPEGLRRDFHALSGLFYVADQHFELFSKHAQDAQASAKAAIETNEAQDLDINLESVIALLREIYPNHTQAPRKAVAEFVEELPLLGYDKIGRLALVLMSQRDRVLEIDKDIQTSVVDLILAQASLGFAHPEYHATLMERVKRNTAQP